ncbi:hypothetical protein PsalMR5_03422 [Piscirickettsia salmonis]|uniref:hypothetical protein n=1 Tax=Piscirickettsia salmonis TaxID=1238 RepID=UPI0012BABE72|nr:hypothetical protein [Piscirickettsia salmonis]QGP55947.1 hypothetical protein PsalSR1_03417 [Piscirickettsia salmonis]QGP58183.1 hypothetical protein PsalBI1_00737 [Piscirickettsia salmonis]QGP65516.1 hypothetical protein PsalMR5_03422 [Piscirickettsia salmonis]
MDMNSLLSVALHVTEGVGLVNLVWYGLERQHSIPIDYRVYDKDTDGKTKNDHFREMLKLGKTEV